MHELEVAALVEKIEVAIYLDRQDYNKRTASVLSDVVDIIQREIGLYNSSSKTYKETGDDRTADQFAYVSYIDEELLKAIHTGMTIREECA